MSKPNEIDPVRAWMFAEKLLGKGSTAEDVAEVEALNVAEIEAEMRADGYDPAGMPTTAQLLARGLERAAKREAERAKKKGR